VCVVCVYSKAMHSEIRTAYFPLIMYLSVGDENLCFVLDCSHSKKLEVNFIPFSTLSPSSLTSSLSISCLSSRI